MLKFVPAPRDVSAWTPDDALPRIGLIDGLNRIFFDDPGYGEPQEIEVGRLVTIDGRTHALAVVMDTESGRLMNRTPRPRVIHVSRGATDRHWSVLSKLNVYSTGDEAWASMHEHQWQKYFRR